MNPARIAVVIPSYRAAGTIRQVIESVPGFVSHIVVVDDACPENSGRTARSLKLEKVCVICHEKNQGVGGAMVSGYRRALELGCDIAVKMDADGQMDPAYMEKLIEPLVCGRADYTKGNRFVDFRALGKMPKARLFGNNVLSFMEKLYSGYWHIMDPTNGYTAISRGALEKLDLSKIAKGYFFESHMLLYLSLLNVVVADVPIPARYGGENSSLSIGRAVWGFPPRLLAGLFKRIFFKYFLYDFNMASVYLLIGVPLFLWGVIFGVYEWIDSFRTGVPKTAGTIMIAALPLILSVEMLLQAIHIDIHNVSQENRRTERSKWTG